MGSFKCYRQLESSDCGVTCIRMVCRHYGRDIPVKYLKGITDFNRQGMSVRDIMSTLRKLEMDSLAVKIAPEYCYRMPLPAILYWRQNHFVVLHKTDPKRKRFHVADPAEGKLVYSEEEFTDYWTADGEGKGVAILAEPKENFGNREYSKESVAKNFFSYLLHFMKLHRRNFIITLLVTLAIMGADFVVPLLLRRTVDEGIGSKDIGLVWLLLLGQLCVAAGGLVASGMADLLLTKTGLGIHIGMVRNFLNKLSRFPLSFFDRKVSSDFVQKIQDQTRIKDFLLTFPSSLLLVILALGVFSVLLFHYSPLIFIFFMAMSLLELGWNTLFLQKRKTLDYAKFNLSSVNANHAYELTNGMADLKVNNAEEAHIEKWNDTQEALNRTSMKSAWLSKLQGTGHGMISRVKDLSVTGIGAAMVINGDLTLGTLMTLGYITGRLSQPFSTLASSVSTLQNALLSFQRIEEVIGEDDKPRGKGEFTDTEIRLEDVWFKYAGTHSPFVLRGINLTIEKGKVTAFVGESGCGKSTLIKLLLGFYEPQKGSLCLGGREVAETDGSAWLRHCGVVMQEARVFSGTILENIALSDKNPDMERAQDVLATVGLKEFTDTLPMGLHTKIGVAGIEMSGGQRQRLMIARALYKNPEILVLDEATSSLDAINERRIVANINRLGVGKTIIISAHRLSTIRHADKIVFLKEGQIVETGTHEDLMELQGEYWNLVKSQLALEEQE